MVHIRGPYCTLILSYLTYCVMVRGHTHGTHLLPLFPKQKKANGSVCDAKHKERTSTLIYNMKLPTIYHIDQ